MLEIDSEDAISMALFGGDDYELCFTIPKEKRDEFEQKWHVRFNTKLSHVGMVTKSLEQYKYNEQDYVGRETIDLINKEAETLDIE